MLARVNVRWLLTVLIVLALIGIALPFLYPPPPSVPPTLVGVEAAPLNRPITPGPGQRATIDEFPSVQVTGIVPAPGVPLTGDADREAAAGLLARTANTRIGPFVHRLIDGLPAIELATASGGDGWEAVGTYVFGPGMITVIDCPVPTAEADERLADCASVVNSLVLA